jgi:hypothetical protein
MGAGIGTIAKLLLAQSFVEEPALPWRQFARERDGEGRQECNVFRWSNPKHAARCGWPPAYLVLVVGLDGRSDQFRLRLNLQEIGADASRPKEDVVAEFVSKILPSLNAEPDDVRPMVEALYRSERYGMHEQRRWREL